MTLPNLLIVGAPKCGTTSMHRYLEQHPRVFMSRQKELGFFQALVGDRWDHARRNEQVMNWRDYKRHFQRADIDHEIVGESTPAYMHHPRIPGKVKSYLGSPHIITGIRDPVERAFSAWLMGVRNRQEHRSFRQCITDPDCDYIRQGFYLDAIRAWEENFPGRVLVYDLSQLARDPDRLLAQVCRFLGIEPMTHKIDTSTNHNKGLVWRNRLFQSIATSPRVERTAKALLPQKARTALVERVLTKPKQDFQMSEEERTTLQDIYRQEIKDMQPILAQLEGARPWE